MVSVRPLFLGEACIKIVPTSQNHAYSEDRSRLLARLKPILCDVKQNVRDFQKYLGEFCETLRDIFVNLRELLTTLRDIIRKLRDISSDIPLKDIFSFIIYIRNPK